MTKTNGTSTAAVPIGFTANDGVRWTVRELNAEQGDGRPCLVFECDGVIRRVRVFPPDWRGLDSASLSLLSWKT